MINPYLLASSITFDTIVLGKQKSFSTITLILFSAGFHALAFTIGLVLGQNLINLIGHIDHWISFAIFTFLGSFSIQAFLNFDKDNKISQVKSYIELFLIAAVLSIDAAIIGASSSNLITTPHFVIFLIAISSAVFVFIGKYINDLINAYNQKFLKLFEGLLFWSVGLGILISHING